MVVARAGYLASVDSYMNLQLANTEEYIDGQFTGNLGEVLIRCVRVSRLPPCLWGVRRALPVKCTVRV
jgi:hypothetical protein